MAYRGFLHRSRRAEAFVAAESLARWDSRGISASRTVALGFAGWKPGLGGVRNHLQMIDQCSSHRTRIFPGSTAMRLTDRDSYVSALWRPSRARALRGFGVLHSHVDPQFIRACRTAGESGSPWVHTYHTLYFHETAAGLLPWKAEINRALIEDARHADVRIAVSPWLQAMLRDKYGIDSVCVPNGVDIARCERALGDRFTSRTGLSRFIVFVGSLDPVKNADLFMDLAEATADKTFVMIGKNLTVGALRVHRKRDLPRNLIPLGPLSHSDTLDAIAAAQAMVMPSHVEGFPTALLEAMALGKPVVATNGSGCRDAVGDDSSGVLFERGNLEAAKAGLEVALNQPDIGNNAARRVRDLFDWQVVIRQLDAIYERLMQGGRGA